MIWTSFCLSLSMVNSSVCPSVGGSDGRHKCHTYVSSVFGQTRVMGVRDERVSAARANVDMNDDGRPVASAAAAASTVHRL